MTQSNQQDPPASTLDSAREAVRAAYLVSHECTISDAALSVAVRPAEGTSGADWGAEVIVSTIGFVSQRGQFWGRFHPALVAGLAERGLRSELINEEVVGVRKK